MSAQEIKTKLTNLLRAECIFIFKGVDLSAEITTFIIDEKKIKKVFFIGYDEDQVYKIKSAFPTIKEVFFVSDFDYKVIKSKTFVFCIENSSYEDNDYIDFANNNTDANGLIFSGIKSRFLKTLPSGRVETVEKPFIQYLQEIKTLRVIKNDFLAKRDGVFHNRTNEIICLDKFLAEERERLLIIKGFPGYGKTKLVEELTFRAPQRLYAPFTFQSSDTYKDVIREVSPRIEFFFNETELEKTDINNKEDLLVNNFIQKLHNTHNVTLIFDEIDVILLPGGRFINIELKEFFTKIIKWRSFEKSNKIIFLTKTPVLVDKAIAENKVEIDIGRFKNHYIKLIMKDAFQRKNEPALANKIMNYEESIIDKAVCGHPLLAKSFVAFALRHDMDEILTNQEYLNEISYKIKYDLLLDRYPLNRKEEEVLEILSLFNDEIPSEFLSITFSDHFTITEELIDRYLLEPKTKKEGSIVYYVPSLIKDYMLGKMSKEPQLFESKRIKSNNEIGDYFWNKARNPKTPYYEKSISYRKAFHHYKEAGNEEKLRSLFTRFNEKFLSVAWKLALKEKWEDAFFYFNELYSHNLLGNNVKNYSKFLHVVNRLKNKPSDIDSIFEKIHSEFSDNSFVVSEYADHLIKKPEDKYYDIAVEVCSSFIDFIGKNSYVQKGLSDLEKNLDLDTLKTTTARAFNKLKKFNEANALMKELENYYTDYYKNDYSKISKEEEFNIQSILIALFNSLDIYNTYFNFRNNINQILRKINIRTTEVPFLKPGSEVLYCLQNEIEAQIKNQYERIDKELKIKRDKEQKDYKEFLQHIISVSGFNDYCKRIKLNTIDNDTKNIIRDKFDSMEKLINEARRISDKTLNISKRKTDSIELESFKLFRVQGDFNLLQKMFKENFENERN